MKITITRSCGHDETVALFGAHADRDRKIEWMKTSKCSECYKSEQETKRAEERAAELQAAKSASDANALPELTGSEKQINWALVIRAKLIEGINYIVAKTKEAQEEGRATEEQATRVYQIVDAIIAHDDAKYWIDNRDHDARSLINKEAKQFINREPV